ncbi:PDDEXK-like family protein [Nonlabens agnitus]|uniref:PD-(D/E)XK nuclease superfamily protein n=1 Tax=Nonlabens agnitus TaxID=870484 RepID=A0A2S9WRZ9_9FLAO|nr:PD-(D/E)XK nuclease family protein [Nonlabens agnitus]PRP66263.1 hypothetical protein BST86_03735 [Nonlabens agnitus]
MIDINEANDLLKSTREIVQEHQIETRERGEDFNLFSVLSMEFNETKTHSSMIRALLDPKENHYQGDAFLKLFLKEIGYDHKLQNLNVARVQTEFHLGKISEDYLRGGFIDILISLSDGQSIAIENKIYAGDQPSQMYRYSQYNQGSCRLYYLTLFGNQPSKDSLHSLTNDEYSVMSYRNHIISWLERCLQVVPSGSIIETSIRQYYILIKRLTNTMEDTLEIQLKNIIGNHLEEAKFIHSHYEKTVESIRKEFKEAIHKRLKSILDSRFNIREGNDITATHSQLWIDGQYAGRNIIFGIESFSGLGHNHGRLFVGVIDKAAQIDLLQDGDVRFNYGWQAARTIVTSKGNPLNLSSINILQDLISDKKYFSSLVESVAQQAKDFVDIYQEDFDRKVI